MPFYAIKGLAGARIPWACSTSRTPHPGRGLRNSARRYLGNHHEPLGRETVHEFGGDITKFRVVKIGRRCSQIAVSRPTGRREQSDISSLVGKIDIRKLETRRTTPTPIPIPGGLCAPTRACLEFVEMFKAPIKVLHPLLTATQGRNYKSAPRVFGAIPFDGLVLAHSNEAEWLAFKNNRNNEAFSTASISSRSPIACASRTNNPTSTRSC